MSCNESDPIVERDLELAADREAVWAELPAMLGDDVELVAEPGGALRVDGADGERIGVVQEVVPGERLSFRWTSTDGDAPPSEVEITLEPSGVGTIVHVRETRLDGSHLVRSAFTSSVASV